MNVRQQAIGILDAVLNRRRKADQQLDAALSTHAPDARDRRFLHELVYGVLRRYFSLEADFSRYLQQKPDEFARLALFIGTYQLRHMRVPAHAAVGETVAAVKPRDPKASGMVNAVLRKVSTNEPPARLKPHQRAELPKWLYAAWRDAFGADAVQQFCALAATQPPLCVAVFEDRETWMDQLREAGVEVRAGELSPHAVLLPVGTDVTGLPGFNAGAFTVMDQAAQAAVTALEISKQDGVMLDVCAAPGGKTALLSHRFPDARIMAVELNVKRIPRLKENLARLHCQNAGLLQTDGRTLPIPDAAVDGILLDAPCSASGVLRRHPDAKFLHDRTDVDRHAALQKTMLAEAMRVLRPGGCLVYAVCSIHPEENEQVVEGLAGVESMQRLYPDKTHDGFFVAKLRKP
ncbi:MAG: transcription antitermination factor NusB [Mariprofundaceae bacterium]|nr:transcription antitermination factor NusB [Mariprofundaceae bacterium]